MIGLKEGLVTILTVLVGGVIVAGAVVGWDKIIPKNFFPPDIKVLSVERNEESPLYSGEQLKIELKGVETDLVYWVFEEGRDVRQGKISVQHVFPQQGDSPELSEGYRRIDAFYRAGGKYGHVSRMVLLKNYNVKIGASTEESGVEFYIESAGYKWKGAKVSFVKYEDGEFVEVSGGEAKAVVSSSAGGVVGMWGYDEVARAFSFGSDFEAMSKVNYGSDNWISAEITLAGGGEKIRVLAKIQSEYEREIDVGGGVLR